jgi:plastocyanin
MTKRWLALLLGCLALALVAAGCGGGDDNGDSGGNGGGGGGNANQEPAPAAKSGGAQVSMKDIKFNPSTVNVKVGDTVTWTNDDSVGHDVTSDTFKSGDAGGIANGQTFEHKFDKAGTFKYVCTVHPGMTGEVVVK